MSEVLEVSKRELVGKRNNLRLRKSGMLPAVLYGHGKDCVKLTVSSDELDATLRHGAKVVQLTGAADGQALMHSIQWDPFQQHVLHIDFLRVEATDRVTVEVPLLLRGEAPGEHEGGNVEHLLHSVELEVAPANVPEQLHVSVNKLQLGGVLTIADIEDLPPGAKVLAESDTAIAQCVEPTVVEEEEETAAESAEPEVIGRKEEDEEETEQ